MHELKMVYQRYFSTAVALAFLLHMGLIGAAVQWTVPRYAGKQLPIRILPYTDLMRIDTADEPAASAPVLPPPTTIPPKEEAPPPAPLSKILPVPDWMAVDSLMADTEVAPTHDIASPRAVADAGGSGGTGQARAGANNAGAAPGGGIRVDEKPRWLKRVEPEYPRIAKLTGVEGVVILSVYIDEAGHVTDTKVLKSLGNTGCDDAAVTAAMQWRFIPARVDGRPLAMWFSVPVLFQLKAN
ncbi:MAG: energy transducer TonB [Candidatus Latescibacteria bacterium]|jgi:periplasmic protein TonB|nr:energy transducer TonB [Candidatus Latescibacterota bacterium]